MPVAPSRHSTATPADRARELARALHAAEQEAAGPERAARLAPLIREAHTGRQLNLAIHAAGLCLADDPAAPELLVSAYLEGPDPSEDRLRALQDLRDLARYVERDDLDGIAERHLLATARAWLVATDAAGRRHRLRTLTAILPRGQVDGLRDELRTREGP